MFNECNKTPCYRSTIFMKFHEYIPNICGQILYKNGVLTKTGTQKILHSNPTSFEISR